jgi:hypothetical protein
MQVEPKVVVLLSRDEALLVRDMAHAGEFLYDEAADVAVAADVARVMDALIGPWGEE